MKRVMGTDLAYGRPGRDHPREQRRPSSSAKWIMVDRLQHGEIIKGYREGGNSMVPLIRSRQPVDIRPIDREIKVKDIVFARVGGLFFMHLVTAIEGDRVQISNNHGHVNGWTHKSQVFGFVIPS